MTLIPSENTQPMASINIVPLIGVLAALLVVAMMAFPRPERAFDYDMSRVCFPSKSDLPQSHAVEVLGEGHILLDGQAIDVDDLKTSNVFADRAAIGNFALVLGVHRNANYDDVTDALAALQSTGLADYQVSFSDIFE